MERIVEGARLEVERVKVVRDGRAVVDGATLSLEAGGIATVQGPSGSGKSTLLRAIATLIPIDDGRIRLGGRDARELPAADYRRRVAYVPQLPRMFDGTVAENVRAGPSFRGVALGDGAVLSLLEQVGLGGELASRAACELSGGEKLRVALARALANEPTVLLLDEPTSALDPDAARVVLDLVDSLARVQRCGVIAVTHAAEHAERLGGARWRMAAGVLEART